MSHKRVQDRRGGSLSSAERRARIADPRTVDRSHLYGGKEGHIPGFYSYDLASALTTAKPLADISELAIPDLTAQETNAFWQAINE